MSASPSGSELASTPQAQAKRNGRPQSAEAKMKNKASKSPKPSSKGLMKIFRNKKAKENGVVPVRPSCFNDDFVRRPESPDSPSRGPGVASSASYKAHKGKDERPSYGLWRSKVGLERNLIGLSLLIPHTFCNQLIHVATVHVGHP